MTDPARLSACDAGRRIAEGSLTSEALVRACLARIAERESQVHAWEHLDAEQALGEARQRDREPSRGPLHGVPVGVKDIMDTVDQPTTYGSHAYQGHRPSADAACVTLARAAGMVVLGKTVTTEFAAMSPGKTRNPHDAKRTPGGSSSGSVAAVADYMVPLAFGTQTSGSIIRPAAFCGIVGYKPSFGLVAIAGTKCLAPGLDTVGGFARSVVDVATFIGALTDRPSLAPQEPAMKPRIGIYPTAPFDQAEQATRAALDAATKTLQRSGMTTSPREPFPRFDRLGALQATIMLYEAARNLSWERLHRAEAISPQSRGMLEDGAAITAAAYDAAQKDVLAARARIEEFFGAFDAMLVPAARGEAPIGMPTGDPVFNRPWTLLHVPCVTLPGAKGPNGMPVGLQLVGRAGEDERLLAVARAVEEALASNA